MGKAALHLISHYPKHRETFWVTLPIYTNFLILGQNGIMSFQQEITLIKYDSTDLWLCVSIKEAEGKFFFGVNSNKICLLHAQCKSLLLNICSSVSFKFWLHLLVLSRNSDQGNYLTWLIFLWVEGYLELSWITWEKGIYDIPCFRSIHICVVLTYYWLIVWQSKRRFWKFMTWIYTWTRAW